MKINLIKTSSNSLGKHLFKITEAFNEPIFINLLLDNKGFMVFEVEPVRSKLLKETLSYNPTDDENEDSSCPENRGVI